MKRYAGNDYYFIINRVKLEDRGEYIIRAENHYGTREEVVFLNVHPLPKEQAKYTKQSAPIRRREPLRYNFWQEECESAPHFTFLLRPRVMQTRDTCKLLCCLSGKPVPSVKWFKDGIELSRYEYVMYYADGVVAMEIVDCKPSDSGKYSCKATNCHGTDETDCIVLVEGENITPEQANLAHNFLYSGDRKFIEKPIKPATPVIYKRWPVKYRAKNDVTSPTGSSHHESTSNKQPRSRTATKELILAPDDSVMCKPEFIKQLQDITIVDGDQLVLSCHVRGDPEPQISWCKNGSAISSSNIIDLKYKNGIATLTIQEVFAEDEGLYSCIASNSISSNETKCRVTVESAANRTKSSSSVANPPKILSHLDSRYVHDGDLVTLACRIAASGPLDVVWLHNNKHIKPNKEFIYSNEANIYKLTIAEIFPEDSGTYTCEAFNDAGESYSTCTINVIASGESQKEPIFTKFPTSVTVEEGETTSFQCELKTEPLQLTWIKDGKEIAEDDLRYTLGRETPTSYTFTIKKSSMCDVGQYQAKAIGKENATMAAFSLNLLGTK